MAWLTFSCRISNALMEVRDCPDVIDETVDKVVCFWNEPSQNPRNSRCSMEHNDMHDRCCVMMERRKGLGP